MSARSFLVFPRLSGAFVPNVAHLIPAGLETLVSLIPGLEEIVCSFLDGPELSLGAIQFALLANGH